MPNYTFLFDLDSTITKCEILPEIARQIGKYDEMRHLTETAMRGNLPFESSFSGRVKMLKDVSVTAARRTASEVPLNEGIADFIRRNSERCYVATGNLDIWIYDLMEKLNMLAHCFCSEAEIVNDRVIGIRRINDKAAVARGLPRPLVVIGDGDNDLGMTNVADIVIGFGGARPIAPALLQRADHVFYDDRACADFLWTLLRGTAG